MKKYIKEVVQKPKITRKEHVLHIIIYIILLVTDVLARSYVELSTLKELLCLILVIARVSCILHWAYRLHITKIWFDVDEPEYENEYIEILDDHIKIYERLPSYSGHNYSYAKVYFDDIKLTRMKIYNVKKRYEIRILIKKNASQKTILCNNREKDIFVASLKGYPSDLIELIIKQYGSVMNLIVTN